jgi:hypothetical protein
VDLVVGVVGYFGSSLTSLGQCLGLLDATFLSKTVHQIGDFDKGVWGLDRHSREYSLFSH